MPKQADIRVQVPGCTAAHFWDVVYERAEAAERYHTSFNASTATSVTPWSSCQRTVNFTMPLKMPDFVKRMVGLETVAVTEVQRVVWHGGGSFTVTSETNITNMMGAARFTTALQLTVTEQRTQQQPAAAASDPAAAPSGGPSSASELAAADGSLLQLMYSVRCAAASVPWPMSATIENLMAEKALVSMQSFLDFCTQLLEEQAAGAEAAAAADNLGAADGAGAAASRSPGASLAPPAASALAAGGPSPPLLSPGLAARSNATLRHRWPSVTSSHDMGGAGAMGAAGDSFLLRRQDTLGGGGGDMFWDAPENFTSGGSGVSSGGLSPSRGQFIGPPPLRRLSSDCAVTTAAGAASHSGPAAAASAVAVGAVATETHHVAVAVDRLAVVVAALDNKMDRLLQLQQLQQQLLQHLQADSGVVAAAALRDAGSGSSRRGPDSALDTHWLLRVTAAVLLATLLVVGGCWALHPHATGYRPHDGGGGDAPSGPTLPAVLRIDGGDAALGSSGGGGGGSGGGDSSLRGGSAASDGGGVGSGSASGGGAGAVGGGVMAGGRGAGALHLLGGGSGLQGGGGAGEGAADPDNGGYAAYSRRRRRQRRHA